MLKQCSYVARNRRGKRSLIIFVMVIIYAKISQILDTTVKQLIILNNEVVIIKVKLFLIFTPIIMLDE